MRRLGWLGAALLVGCVQRYGYQSAPPADGVSAPGDPRGDGGRSDGAAGDAPAADLGPGDAEPSDSLAGDTNRGDDNNGDTRGGDTGGGDLAPAPIVLCSGFPSGTNTGTMISDTDLSLQPTNVGHADIFPSTVMGLQAYWRMSGSIGAAVGSTLPADFGSAVGARIDGDNTMFWAAPRVGSASMQFDGVDDAYDLGNPAELRITGAMTLSAWVYVTSNMIGGTIIGKAGAEEGWRLTLETGMEGGFPTFTLATSASTTVSVTTPAFVRELELNAWYHIVGVYEPSSRFEIYVNGLPISATIAPPPAQYDSVDNAFISEGSIYGSFPGRIDEVGIWSRALSPVEIDRLHLVQAPERFGFYRSYTCGSPTPVQWAALRPIPRRPLAKPTPTATETAYSSANFSAAGLAAIWSFDGLGMVAAVADRSGNLAHGTAMDTGSGVPVYWPSLLGESAFLSGGARPIIEDDPTTLDVGSAFSVSLWFRAGQDPGAVQFLAGEWSATLAGYKLDISPTGNVNAFVSDGVMQQQLIGPFVRDFGWHHAALVYEQGTRLALYVDGAPAASAVPGLIVPSLPGTPFQAGADGPSDGFVGFIDEVAVFNRALTDPEADALWKRGALRARYQVRSCLDMNCMGETLVGPGNDPWGWFSSERSAGPGLDSFDLSFLAPTRFLQFTVALEGYEPLDAVVIDDVEVLAIP